MCLCIDKDGILCLCVCVCLCYLKIYHLYIYHIIMEKLNFNINNIDLLICKKNMGKPMSNHVESWSRKDFYSIQSTSSSHCAPLIIFDLIFVLSIIHLLWTAFLVVNGIIFV